jgi:hypothetical protein
MTQHSIKSPKREYAPIAEKNPQARALVDKISDRSITVDEYKATMLAIGGALAEDLVPNIAKGSDDVYVVCTVEDADFLARGIFEYLSSKGFSTRLKLMCLWNGKIRDEGVSLSPVLRQYKEEQSSKNASFIVVKSIISGACVVKTNLTRAISSVMADQVFVVSPVLLNGAKEKLEKEFPSEIASKFRYFWLATDFEKVGEEVLPGIGGSVYERLGFGDEENKNRYTPELVKVRRRAAAALA